MGKSRLFPNSADSNAETCRYKADDVNKTIIKDLKKFVPKPRMAEVSAKTINEMYHTEFSQKGDNKREMVTKIETLNSKIKTARELL